MGLFKRAESTSAYLKAGFLGFQGSGKTYTATQVAIGVAKMMVEKKLPEAGRPIFFLDTETGSDYVTPLVRKAGLDIHTAKTRSFIDLLEAIAECEKYGSFLIIDSITHFWREFCESYQRRKNVKRLDFQDWNFLKGSEGWGAFTDRYVNSSVHIAMCGRAGYEYDTETDDRGKKQQVKSGVKMKAETETGFEPSLLVLMEREMDVQTNEVTRVAYVLKERFAMIDGKSFPNPTFETFLPHIQLLNLGGKQLGVDTSRNSDQMFGEDGDTRFRYEMRQKEIALDEIKEEIFKHLGQAQDAASKTARADLLEKIAGTRSWAKLEGERWPLVKEARANLWLISRGHAYGAPPPSTETPQQDSVAGAENPEAKQPVADSGHAGASAQQIDAPADPVIRQFDTESAVRALRSAGTIADLNRNWADVNLDFRQAGKELPLEVDAAFNETREALAAKLPQAEEPAQRRRRA